MGESSVLTDLCAAIALEPPEEALARALSVLAALGIVARAPDRAEPWLVVESGNRSLSLFAESALESTPPIWVVKSLLRSALSRAVADERARKAEERLEMLSAASFEGILVHDDGLVVDVNRRFAEMVGYEPAEIVGENTTRRLVAPEDLSSVLERMQSGYEGAYVITGVRKDGSRFRAELQSKQGHQGDRPVRVVAMRDVTERERTAALVRESEAHLRDLAEGAFDGIVFVRSGVVVDSGGRLRERLGIDPDRIKSLPIVEIVAPSSRNLVARLIDDQRIGSWEIEIVSESGEHIAVELVLVRSTLDGEPVLAAGLRDMREKRRLESERTKLVQKVEQGQRLESLGVLAAGIAHDFNNLLVGVLGNADLLLSGVTDALHHQAAQAIRSAGERAAALTAQMLACAGRREYARRESVDLVALSAELRELLGAVLSKKARLDFSIQPESIVLGDRATLTQLLVNLLTNASDALRDAPGTITVATHRTRQPDARFHEALGAAVGLGDWIVIEVKDTGTGMCAATMARVFEPFFSTKETGHGLGLAACLGIVTTHGGAITVESEVGRGSCFSVILPAARSTRASIEASTAQPPRAIRVLVVDDEPLVRSLVRRLLERRGFSVEEACDGRSGLDAIDRNPFDLMVLDMTMPDLDGAQVVRRMRANGSKVPILLSSGYMASAAEKAIERSMIQGFLAKPFTTPQLMEAIDRVLASK